jgi:hypothetical protein
MQFVLAARTGFVLEVEHHLEARQHVWQPTEIALAVHRVGVGRLSGLRFGRSTGFTLGGIGTQSAQGPP